MGFATEGPVDSLIYCKGLPECIRACQSGSGSSSQARPLEARLLRKLEKGHIFEFRVGS